MAGYVKGGILAGIILFIWGAISWMALGWHTATLNGFNDEKAVSEVIVANAPKSGIYVIPFPKMEMNQNSPTLKPFVFISVNEEGVSSSMIKQMIVGLISQIIAAILVGWMLSKTTGVNYLGRVGFVLLFAIAASIVTHGNYWNWFTFDTNYTLVAVGDMIIGWLFAGFILAKYAYRGY